MPKPKVAVYGLTSEGYSVAARLIEKASVTIVDETLQMAMDLEPGMVKTHRTVQELVGDEMLMGLKPVSQVLSERGGHHVHAEAEEDGRRVDHRGER